MTNLEISFRNISKSLLKTIIKRTKKNTHSGFGQDKVVKSNNLTSGNVRYLYFEKYSFLSILLNITFEFSLSTPSIHFTWCWDSTRK